MLAPEKKYTEDAIWQFSFNAKSQGKLVLKSQCKYETTERIFC